MSVLLAVLSDALYASPWIVSRGMGGPTAVNISPNGPRPDQHQ